MDKGRWDCGKRRGREGYRHSRHFPNIVTVIIIRDVKVAIAVENDPHGPHKTSRRNSYRDDVCLCIHLVDLGSRKVNVPLHEII